MRFIVVSFVASVFQYSKPYLAAPAPLHFHVAEPSVSSNRIVARLVAQ